MLENLGQRIKDARQKKKLTQADLAKMIGVSTATVGQYEVNSSKPSLTVLLKISNVCEVNTDWLLKGGESLGFDYKDLSEEEKDYSTKLVNKLKKELNEKEEQIKALSYAINFLRESSGKIEVIDHTAGGCQDQPPIRRTPESMTKQLEEAA